METCLWCTASATSKEDVTAVLRRYCTGGFTSQEMQDANNDLIYCMECVVEYHRARQEVSELHKRLWELETARLLDVFREMLEVKLDDYDLLIVDNGQEQPVSRFSPEEFHNRLRFPLMEVLKYPYLLCHRDVCEMVVNVLCKMEDMNNPLPVHDRYQGTYLLMVHPNEMVRRWAIDAAKSLGRVDRDSYYDLKEVFSCMFYVIDLGISLDIEDEENVDYWCGELKRLPSHLYDSRNKKNYWLGISMLLMQLDSQAMESLFMGPQASFPQCIINTMNDSTGEDLAADSFWPALHCFMIILDRLGSKIWSQIEPIEAFQAIIEARSYTNELENIRRNTSGSRVKTEPQSGYDYDDQVSCSQMVYDCYAVERKNRSSDWSNDKVDSRNNVVFDEMNTLVSVLQKEMGQGMRVYGSTFLWFIPFAHSVTDHSGYVGEVLHHLEKNLNKSLLSGQSNTCDKVTELFIQILVYIIELCQNKGCLRVVSFHSYIWVKVIVQGASLSDEIYSNRTSYWRGGSSKVSSTTSNFGSLNRIPATGVGAIRQACMKLIRSLLREGVRVGTVTDSGHFLDLVNRHMWGSTTKAWNLNPKESEDLQKCLKALVKAISERHGTLNDIVLCAPPTPPIDPPENETSPSCSGTDPLQKTRDVEAGPSGARDPRNLIKDEPPWIYGEHHDLCGDVKTKKETLSPVLVSDFRPPVELHHLKPDLEKVQEIRSKLIDHKLSKLQNIATTRLEVEQPTECSGLKETSHASNLNSHPTNVLSKTLDPARLSTQFIEKEKPVRWDDDDDDDEPLDVRKRRLKRRRWVPSDSDQSSDDRPTSVQSSKSVKVNDESGVINILDDEPITDNTRRIGVNLPADNAVNRETNEPPLDENLNECPSRDFDDLSESQVFEFETQEDVPSVWRDSQIDRPVTKKLKLDTTSKALIGHGAVEPTSEFVVETQPVRDEDIEKACQQVEEQISEQKQLQQPVASSLLVPSKPSSSGEKFENFVKPKSVTSKSPPKKLSLPNKTDKLGMSRKPVIIEPLGQKVKQRSRAHRYVSQDTEKPGCSVTSTARRSSSAPSSTPAIVPVKKVRKRIEPELPAELLGLKKKERKAFELSQRTTDTLQELRSHGQNVLIEKNQKTKRVRRNSKTQPKLAGKGGKKLLGSQDMQFFRQSREMLPKTVPSAAGPAPVRSSVSDALPKLKCRPENGEESDEDDFFLPCSQPDPDRRTADENTAGQAATDASCDANQVESRETNSKAAQHAESKKDGASDSDDEWTLLTQNEPTDMELCSQMEEMEEAYGTDFFQGDPLDKGADNQPNIFDGSVSVPHKPSPALVTQKAPPATTTRDEQPLFAKPATPPVSQSKAKPSTAKIYTTSSRSASLAEEMGKTPAVPPAANVAKAKHVRPPHPAQHEFRQPLPSRPTLPPRNHHFPVAPTGSKVNLASNPPTYKPYSRPEAPVSMQTARVNQAQRFDSARKYDAVKSPLTLKEAVLKWEYRWFENYKQFGPPDDLCSFRLQQVPVTFSSFDEYFSIFYPLLLINLFEEMADQWVNGVKSDIKLWFQTTEYSRSVAKFTGRLTPEQELKQLYPKDDDLVLLLLPENAGAYAHDESVFGFHFGFVTQHKVLNNRGGQPTTLEVTIHTLGNVSSVNSTPVRCQTIGSMVTALREFRALCLAKDTMEKPLLTLDVRYFTPCQEGLPNLDMPEYNRDQAKAIAYGFAMVKRKITSPKILLIHGPPGTGKSKTIVGLLHRLLTDSQSHAVNRYGKPRKTRILVCAPSNAAIDNLMKKIIVLFKDTCKNLLSPQGTCGDINLVRLGSEKSIAEGLQSFSHDSQIKKKMEKLQMSSNVDIHRKRGELDKLIHQLSLECAKAKQDKNMTQFETLNARKQQYSKDRETLSRQLKKFYDTKQEIQTRLLIEANIICCTLSKSGSVVLESAFRQLGHEPFSCVIVDEAGQAKETETLIPLRFRCPSLILVGDPEQLPPTVISQKAKELGFDQSLMARVWKGLENSNHRPPPTVFLSMQYRMHPYICEFPSKYIYGSNLKNDCEMAQKCCSASWPFEPYRVFDVTDGRESKEGDSFINQKEVKLVVLLLKLLRDKRPEKTRIGVITPYNAQKRRITEALSKSNHTVEVDTVDGFQGREMECIIVSCVRAGNEMGSIGFVGNRHRMNVTITRAKFSLFILGHVRTLKEQSDWGALIDDAADRGIIISTAEHDFTAAIEKVLKQPVRLSRSYSHPPDHVSTPSTSTSSAHAERIRDHRPSSRNLDPRISKTNEAHLEHDRGNRSRSHSRPTSRYSTDSRHNQSSSRSSRSPSDPRLKHFPLSSSSSRSGR